MMRFIRTIVSVLLALCAFFASGRASGAIITVEVEGIVDSIGTEGGFGLDGSVGVGSVMSGFCVYDTGAENLLPPGANGQYSMISISMSVGNYTFSRNPTSLSSPLFTVYTVDPVYVASTEDARFDGTITVSGTPQAYDDITWGWTYMELFNLWTSEGEYIPTNALPNLDSWPELSVFDNRKVFETRFYGQGDDYFGIYGGITSL
ncbi:MAG: hypothetical protein ACYSU6_06425, partial [Planctomycetota bacterium]